MSVLITGGAGYIGSHAVHAFRDAGHRVVVLDNLCTGVAANLPRDVPLVVADAGDPAVLDAVFTGFGVKGVLHFAGSVVVPESVSDPGKYYANNTATSLEVLRACARHGVDRLVFSSTAAVYGLPASGVATEDTPTRPINPYGWSKLMTEYMIRDMAAAHGLRFAILRYFNVAGADPRGRTGQSTPQATHLIKVACQVATGQRQSLSIFGTDYDTPDGTGVRDFIHVWDLAEAHRVAFDHLTGGGESLLLNCGNGRGYSVREVVAALAQVTGRPIAVTEGPRRSGDPARLIADPSRLRARLPWTPHLTELTDMLRTALEWEEHEAAAPRDAAQ